MQSVGHPPTIHRFYYGYKRLYPLIERCLWIKRIYSVRKGRISAAVCVMIRHSDRDPSRTPDRPVDFLNETYSRQKTEQSVHTSLLVADRVTLRHLLNIYLKATAV